MSTGPFAVCQPFATFFPLVFSFILGPFLAHSPFPLAPNWFLRAGKIFLSAGDAQLAIIAHVPKALQESKKVTAREWVDAVIKPIPNAEIVSETDEIVKVIAKQDKEKGLFPLKLRDEAISAGVAFLRDHGFLPADDDSSDDDVNYAEAAGVEW